MGKLKKLSGKYGTNVYMNNTVKIINKLINTVVITYLGDILFISGNNGSNGWQFILKYKGKLYELYFDDINIGKYVSIFSDNSNLYTNINEYYGRILKDYMKSICLEEIKIDDNYIYEYYRLIPYYKTEISKINTMIVKNSDCNQYSFDGTETNKSKIYEKELVNSVLMDYFINKRFNLLNIYIDKYKKYDDYYDKISDIYDIIEKYSIYPNKYYKYGKDSYKLQVKKVINKIIIQVKKLKTIGVDKNGKNIRRMRMIDVINEEEKTINYLYDYNDDDYCYPLDKDVAIKYKKMLINNNINTIKYHIRFKNEVYYVVFDRISGKHLNLLMLT